MKKTSYVQQIISKNHSYNEQGITLVALIVTIIVLLILSGITIASFKQSNIITKAKDSAKRYSASQIDEKIDMAQQNLVAEREGYDYSIKDLVDEVKKENKDIETIFVDESNNGRKATYIIDDYFYDFTKKDDGIIAYNRKADASDKDKEKYKNKNELRGLKSGIITFKNDKTDWTNENVNVTIGAKTDDKSIQEKIDNGTYFVVSTVNDATKLTTLTKGITSQVATNQGDTIYACLTDGYGTYVATATERIDNIDKTAPTDAKPIAKTTTNSITVTNNQEDKPGAKEVKASGIKETQYQIKKNEDTKWGDLQSSGTFTGLTQGIKYDVRTLSIDNAGNAATSQTTTVTTGTIGEVGKATATPTSWTNKDVTVTLPTITGFTTMYTTNGIIPTATASSTTKAYSSPFTVSTNCTVLYVYTDGTNINSAGTLTIDNIDKTAPTKPTYKAFYDDGKTTYTSGTWTNQHVKTDISSIDANSGINRIEFSFDKNSWTKFQFELSNGLHQNGTTYTGTESWGLTNRNDTVYFRSIDNAGNISEVFDSFNIRYDVTAPTAESPTQISATASSITVQNNQTDSGGSGVKARYYSINNGNWVQDNNTTHTFSGLSEETSYSIKTRMIDNAGNATDTSTINVSTKSVASVYAVNSDGFRSYNMCYAVSGLEPNTVYSLSYSGWYFTYADDNFHTHAHTLYGSWTFTTESDGSSHSGAWAQKNSPIRVDNNCSSIELKSYTLYDKNGNKIKTWTVD